MNNIRQSEPEIHAEPKQNIAVKIFVLPIVRLRELVARGLLKLGFTPNILTVLGTIFAVTGAYYLATGAEQTWQGAKVPNPFYAGIFFFLTCAMDMLDGNLARIGKLHSTFGGMLDSMLDRVSDMAICGGIALAYARINNLTFCFLSLIALGNFVMISYIKARAECEIQKFSVGYWQRGERMLGILIACFAGNINTLIVIMATLPALTVIRRLHFCYLRTETSSEPKGPGNPIFFWRYERGSWPFVVISAVYILTFALVKIPPVDFLASILN